MESDEQSQTVLYISYTGLLEPLGQSQVYRYLQELSDDHNIVLVTYENPEDKADTERFESLKADVSETGIEWHPLTYHSSPTLPATVWDLTTGFGVAARAIRNNDIDIVHTRSYVPSVLGLLCKRVFGTKFVFDMRGFWADERVDGGMWEEDSRLYRSAKWFETQFFENADVVVSLTEAGIDAIQGFDHVDTSETRFEMIPTCVDTGLFTPQHERRQDEFVLGYVGSVGTWYLFDDVLECFELLRERRPDSQLRILNQGDHDYVYDRLAAFDIDESAVTVEAVEHDEVPTEMNKMDAGIFFYTPTFSKKGTSPTKMGEFLACGLPCLSNAAVGDVESILEENGVGVALESFDTEAKRAAIERLVELSTAPATAARCRQVAESYYALEAGVRDYDEIYRTVVADG
ncbi:glycosyltransferase family 4 protein [Halobacteria archaeon AArc-m2/3/4]|uniref:Glycosyltransferase family 4 protein n=1 Tax=Natronoglomus mannanivorans TaxID=2979990 RepID=A0ABT2QJA9_9EURY|nr:glycosyltransferase family 4 protein [Halobacteria archaeon AArc-m2/3/4]